MTKTRPKEENPLISIMLNVVIPVVILTYLSKDKYLGPVWGLVTALILPIGYGIHTLIKEKRADFVSILGIISVLLTGVFGILKLPPQWIAIKEAAIPLIIGLAIVISLKTPYPLIKKMLEENRLDKLTAAIETSADDGMLTFNQSLFNLVKAGRVTEKEAMAKASNPQALEMNFKGIFLNEGGRIVG